MHYRQDLGFSLGLHAAIFLACLILIQKRAADSFQSQPLLVELEAPQSMKTREEPIQQVVRTRAAENQLIPDEKAFLGERNQRVDRQTVSATGSRKAGGSAAPRADKGRADLSRFGIPIIPKAGRMANDTGPGDSRIREYVTGVKEGQETALSTREFVFFGYFERIRGRLEHAWEPILRQHLLRHYRMGRRIASEMDHRTQVQVVLDAGGKVVDVEIVGESGVDTLDSAAIKAFNEAGPFPNPPRGLFDQDGHVRVRWEFILKT